MASCAKGTSSAIQHMQIKAGQNTPEDAAGSNSSWTDSFGKKKLKVEYCDDFN